MLAQLVGPTGKVYGVELVPELTVFGRENCMRQKIKNVEFFQAQEIFGLPEHAPYDRILVSASTHTLPEELLYQLRDGVKIVIPIKQEIHEITKTNSVENETIKHPGFMFVPLKQP